MDPELTSEGKPYAPERYEQIVRERYTITRNCNTSYTDLENVTPKERELLISLIVEEQAKRKEMIEEQNRQLELGRQSNGKRI